MDSMPEGVEEPAYTGTAIFTAESDQFLECNMGVPMDTTQIVLPNVLTYYEWQDNSAFTLSPDLVEQVITEVNFESPEEAVTLVGKFLIATHVRRDSLFGVPCKVYCLDVECWEWADPSVPEDVSQKVFMTHVYIEPNFMGMYQLLDD